MRYLLPLAALALAACSSDSAPPVDSGLPPGDIATEIAVWIDTGAPTDAIDDRMALPDFGPRDTGADVVAVGDAPAADAADATVADAGADAGAVADAPDAASDVPADNGGTCTTVAECPTPPNTNPRCMAGVCRFICFPDTRGDCDGNAANGCEVDSLTDPRNCGGCGVVCPTITPRCVNRNCVM